MVYPVFLWISLFYALKTKICIQDKRVHIAPVKAGIVC